MKKTSLLPLVIIVITFLVIPVAFWVVSSKISNNNVQGVETENDIRGVSVKVKSGSGTWDLNKYLCKDKEECTSNLFSGKSLDIISGGAVENKYINIDHSSDWDSYEYLKVFVKPGWGSTVRMFDATLIGSNSGATIENFVYGGVDYEVVLFPIKNIGNSLIEIASFTD